MSTVTVVQRRSPSVTIRTNLSKIQAEPENDKITHGETANEVGEWIIFFFVIFVLGDGTLRVSAVIERNSFDLCIVGRFFFYLGGKVFGLIDFRIQYSIFNI